jgi:hypothetical protein
VSAASVTATSTSEAVAATSGIANSAAIPHPAIPTAAIPTATIAVAVATASPITSIPGAGADEESTYEPARTVVSVRSACIRGVVVIAPLTDRSGRIAIPVVAIATIADADPYPDLGVSRSREKRCRNHHGAEQQETS